MPRGLRAPREPFAEVRLDDFRALDDLQRLAFRDLLSVVEHDDPVGDAHDRLHHVLDDEERDAVAIDLAEQLHRAVHLLRVEACHDLVQQEKLGVHRQRPGELQPLQVRDREVRRGLRDAVPEADPRQDLLGALARLRGRALMPTRAEHGADRDVVPDAQLLERLDDLERAGDAEPPDGVTRHLRDVLSAKENRPRRRLVQSRDAVDERRLARAVGSDDTEDLPFADRQVHARHGGEAAEPLGDRAGVEQRHRLGLTAHG
jgi:hypothetical protein